MYLGDEYLPEASAAEENSFPDGLSPGCYHNPSDRRLELKSRDRLARRRELDQRKS